MGLARAFSKMGFCSRSAAFELIRGGRVRLNGSDNKKSGNTGATGQRSASRWMEFAVVPAEKVYWMLNKPRGLVTTADDEQRPRDGLCQIAGRIAVDGAGGATGQGERRAAAFHQRFGVGGANHDAGIASGQDLSCADRRSGDG